MIAITLFAVRTSQHDLTVALLRLARSGNRACHHAELKGHVARPRNACARREFSRAISALLGT
eukprot:13611233-Alexandrium_andersonii.AAC.1